MQASKVAWKNDLSKPVPFSKVKELSYVTERLDGATGHAETVAAYKLGVDVDGDGTEDGQLVYEPYYNDTVTGAKQTHDPLGADQSGKWWYSKEPGNQQTLATFAEWAAGTGPVAFTKPEIRSFAVEQGTGNAGAITLVDQVLFKADRECTSVRFLVLKGNPTFTTKPPTKPTTSPTPTASSTEDGGTAGGDSAGDGGGLPVTGPTMAITGGLALAAITTGGVLLAVARRRRATRFVA